MKVKELTNKELDSAQNVLEKGNVSYDGFLGYDIPWADVKAGKIPQTLYIPAGCNLTLTNMSEHDIDRIIQYKLSPINISFQTMNPELRCKMLHNRFAGEIFDKVKRLKDAGIIMNGQIVLCKNVNDGEELERSIRDLSGFIPNIESVSVVPVGLSDHREGLYLLEPFNREDARKVIACIEKWQKKLYEEYGTHFIHASDEWYLLAELPLPEEENYDGYPQLENGVGMLRLLETEFMEALAETAGISKSADRDQTGTSKELSGKEQTVISIGTGLLAAPHIRKLTERFMEHFPGRKVIVYPIENHFFGEMITVSGLLTGQDIIGQLKGKELGERLLTFAPKRVGRPKLLVLHASESGRSSTLWMGRELSRRLSGCCSIAEISLRNGTIHDCRGCSYSACLHFARSGSCFYGGAISETVLPAIRECDAMLFLCPNYNDAAGANFTALFNRLTSLLLQCDLSEKQLYSVIVSGYSGGDLVARQLLGAMCLNKTVSLPPRFCLLETANDLPTAQALPGIVCPLACFYYSIIWLDCKQKKPIFFSAYEEINPFCRPHFVHFLSFLQITCGTWCGC